MSKICYVCGKRPRVARLVSHSNVKTKRWVFPNVHKMRFMLSSRSSDKVVHSSVCTKCVKAGKVTKVI